MSTPVIVDAIRTPVGALGGILASVRPDDMAALVIKEIIKEEKNGEIRLLCRRSNDKLMDIEDQKTIEWLKDNPRENIDPSFFGIEIDCGT